MSRNLSTAAVSRVLGMKEQRIRALVRSGLCRPARQGRSYAFSFQDLVVLRAAHGLMEQSVPAGRVKRALAALVEQLPDDRGLSGLRVFAAGDHVAVRDGGSAWHAETGQTLLNFDVDELAERVEDIRKSERPALALVEDHGVLAQREFERAIELEAYDPATACDAYSRALALDPDLVDAYVNLGRIAQSVGDSREAARLYHEALERSPADPIIHFNLALALEDTRGAGAAAAHYERAIELDPEFADAHYNLAGLCEQLGRKTDAVRHYHAYKRLTQA